MADYNSMRVVDLKELIIERDLPRTGNKAVLIKRLQDNDARTPLPPPSTSPESGSDMLRRFVHQENLRKLIPRLQRAMPAPTTLKSIKKNLERGECLEPSCCLCGSGTLLEATGALFGQHSLCMDGTCANLMECHKCRSVLKQPNEAYVRREQDSCVDASCGNLSRCFRCETCIRDAIVPTSLPEYLQGPYNPEIESGDKTEVKHMTAELRRCAHNRHLRKLLLKLRNEQPDSVEWSTIKQKLREGKCLGLVCSVCGTATFSEIMETLSDGPDVDCGGGLLAKCQDQNKCPTCRQALQDVDDSVSREDQRHCTSGRCGDTTCTTCRNQSQIVGSARQASDESRLNESPNVERYCVEEDCAGIESCGLCQYEKDYEDMKRDEEDREQEEYLRFKRRGQCDGPDPELPYGLGCRYLDCQRCGMMEANMGPRWRNDELRRRRVNNITTSLTKSSDGTMIGASRKRRFSNLDLEYPLSSRHPLGQRIRNEEKREELERKRAQLDHERPSWFGTPEDPLPDFWMGRPILPENEISILKISDSIPKHYLSQIEESVVMFAKDPQEKRLCTIIRRLEAELMSRDFWMQSLGFDANDGFGNFPEGYYTVTGT